MKYDDEIWAPVIGYNGLYEVSNYGRVRSYSNYRFGRRKEPRLMKLGTNLGYAIVGIRKNGKYRAEKVHRLVAQAFIPNPNNYPEIDHINTIRNDNHVSNLRWCDHKTNCNNPNSRKKMCEKRKKVAVAQVKDGVTISRFNSILEASRITGIDTGRLSRAIRWKRKAHGYNWIAI